MLLQRIRTLHIWKQKYILVYSALIFLLLAGCLLQCFLSRDTHSYQGEIAFLPGEIREGSVVYEGISLKPGVYRVGLQYQTDTDYVGICSVSDGTVTPGRLLTNGEHLYAGLGSTGYQIWLLEETDNLQITVSYGGAGNLSVGNLTIVNTGQLWTIIALLVLSLGIAGYVVFVAVAYHKLYGISISTVMTAVFLLLITALASWAQLRNAVLGGADLTYHLQRIEAVKDGLLTGQFPVRIAPEWLYQHGYADPVFYCNTFLLLPALLRLAGLTVTLSYNLFCIALNFATAWIAWFAFGRICKDSRIGLLCSALYTLSFMRIYKLAIVGAVGEGSALTFLPLIFYGMYRIFTEDPKDARYKTAWLPVGLGYAGVIQCHVLTCEITAFVTLLLCLACIRRVFTKPVFTELCKGAGLAVGLSLWYLIPFLDYYLTQDMHIRHVSGRTIQERGLYPGQLLVNSWSNDIEEWLIEKGLVNVEAGCVGVLLLAALVLFVCLWIAGRLKGKGRNPIPKAMRQTAQFAAVMAALLVVMSLRIFPWDAIQESSALMASLVSSLQFPNRFLGWATVFLCMVFGFCMYYFRGRKGAYVIAGAVVVISVGSGSLFMMHHALQEQNSYVLHNEEGMGCGYISGAEYLVEGTKDSLLTFAGPVPGENVLVSHYEKTGLKAKILCENGGTEASYVDLPILLYKGYKAYGEDGESLLVEDGFNHLMRVVLPAGYAGEISVQFESPWYWRVAEMITFLTLLGMLCYLLRCNAKGKKDETVKTIG